MVNLMTVIFLLEVTVYLLNTIGTNTINQLLWRLVTLLPLEPSRMAAEKRTLQKEYLAVRSEMQATSSQDEFAKWARLRRKHDKLYEQLEQKKQRFEAIQGRYNTAINVLRFVLIRAPQYLIPLWYSREPMLWLPKNLFPYYAEWFLSLPKAPLGSVSIGTWQVACAVAFKLFFDMVTSIAVWVKEKKSTKVKVPVSTETSEKGVEEKEEL